MCLEAVADHADNPQKEQVHQNAEGVAQVQQEGDGRALEDQNEPEEQHDIQGERIPEEDSPQVPTPTVPQN